MHSMQTRTCTLLVIAALLFIPCRNTNSDTRTTAYPAEIHVLHGSSTGGFAKYDVIDAINGKRPDVLIPVLPEMETNSAERLEAPDFPNTYMTDVYSRLPASSLSRCLSFYDGVFWDRDALSYSTGNFVARNEHDYLKALAGEDTPARAQLAINLRGDKSFEIYIDPAPHTDGVWKGKVKVTIITAPWHYGMPSGSAKKR